MMLLVLGNPDGDAVERVSEHLGLVDVVRSDDPLVQFDRRFGAVLIGTAGFEQRDDLLRETLHAAAQHLEPGGLLVVAGPRRFDPIVAEFDLTASTDRQFADMSTWRRTARFTVHDLVFEARSGIDRVSPQELHRRLGTDRPPTVIDTRTSIDRERHGVIPKSVHAPRTVLEWHLDPANGYLHPMVTSFDQPIVVVCNGGYSSSLAAASLVRIGYVTVGDLIGGFQAWLRAELPIVPPDHTHLGT